MYDPTTDESFRRESWRGEDYLVGPVVAQREGVYAYPGGRGGVTREYVSADALTDDLDAWESTPLVLRHPESESGEFLTVNHDASGAPVALDTAGDPADVDVAEVGAFRNVDRRDDALAGEVWVRESAVGEHDGDLRDYLEAIADGEFGEVSTGYRVDDFGGAGGRANGEHYDDEQRSITPDHLALLPDEVGNCPVEDMGTGSGCGVGRANEAVRVNATAPAQRANKTVAGVTFEGTGNGTLDQGDLPTEGFEPHYLEPADTKSDSAFPVVDADGILRAGNVASAFQYRRDAADTSALVDKLAQLNGEFGDDPPIREETMADARTNVAAADDPESFGRRFINGMLDAMPGRTNDSDDSAEQGGAEPADGPGSDTDSTDSDPSESGTHMEDTEKIDILVEEYGFDRENIEQWEGEDCLTKTFDKFAADDSDSDDEGDDGEESNAETDSEGDDTEGEVPDGGEQSETETTDGPETPGADGTDEQVVVNADDLDERVNEAATQAVQDVLNERESKEAKAEHIDALADNPEAPFDREELKTMDLDSLKVVASKYDDPTEDRRLTPEEPRANYAGRPTGGEQRANSGDEGSDVPAAGYDNWGGSE